MIQSLLLPTHKVAVIIFLLHYVIKTFLLLINKPEALKKYTAGTKVLEMIISVLFLFTGVWLMVEKGSPSTLQIIKFTLVALSIPIAIVGFKKSNKAMAVTALLFIIGAYGLAEVNKKQQTKVDNSAMAGSEIYAKNCVSCHGEDGRKGFSGASDLSKSVLSADEAKAVISNGRNGMPAIKMEAVQLDSVTAYIQQLKK
jgi:mono/diheme cytochrome c family protein